jgi:membrane protein implicated in regulation of membrane protease activity
MFASMLYFWLVFGVFLILSEMLLPGLVSVFMGFGALTVAVLLHFDCIDSISDQLVTWFVSSTIYIFSLRLLVMRYYPSNREKRDIDEDRAMIGQIVEVVQAISNKSSGRICHGESTWTAISSGEEVINVGEQVQIVGRDNISWTVKKL